MPEENELVTIFIVSALLIAMILILVILFVIAYQRRVATQKLKLKEVEREHQMKLLRATVETQEKERKRIASDLHDDVGSLLSALKVNVDFLEQHPDTVESQRWFLAETREQLEHGIESVRQISYNLYPPTLASFGIWEAIREIVERVNTTEQLKAQLILKDVSFRPDKEVELSLLRVTQELISNTIRHAEANQLTIEIGSNSHGIEIVYRDNGKGLPDTDLKEGLGLMNMQSRISAINGTLIIDRPNTTGFKATIQIPKRS